MLITGLFRRFRVPVDGYGLLLQLLCIHVVNMKAFRREAHDLLILNVGYGSGITQDRWHIGSDEAAFPVLSHNQWAVLSHREQLPGKIRKKDAEGIGAFHPVQHLGDGLHGISLIVIIQHVGQHLRIRFGDKMIAPLRQLFPECQIILDDTVVHHRDGFLFIEMRVGVHIARSAMRSPAGMTDSQRSRHGGAVVGELA